MGVVVGVPSDRDRHRYQQYIYEKVKELTVKQVSQNEKMSEDAIQDIFHKVAQLKNISQIEHSRHRSPVNCFVNILCGLIAYCHQPKKPGIAMHHNLICSA